MPQVIQWVNPKEGEIIWRYPIDRIEWGAQLVVEEWQAACFLRDGKLYDVLRAGRHTLTTLNLPLLTQVLSRVAGFEKSPFVATVIFVSLKQHQLPFGGRSQTVELAPIQFHGVVWFRVDDPALFVTQVVGGQGVYTTEDLQKFLRGFFNELIMAELSRQSIFTMYGNLEQTSFIVKHALEPSFRRVGLQLVDLKFEGLDVVDQVWRDRLFYIRATGVNPAEYLRMETLQKAAAELGKSEGAAIGAGLAIIPPLLWPPQQTQAPQASQGVVCPQCRFVNPSEAKFCMNCGFMLGVKCPQCGVVNPPGAKFCTNCGAKL